MSTPPTLSKEHKNAWITLLIASRSLLKGLDKALEESGKVSMECYDVLLQLEEAPDHRLRMCGLAERSLLSRSGLTRLIDRLVACGYICREVDPVDRRGLFAILTPSGRTARQDAWPVMQAYIAKEFGAKLTREQAHALEVLLKPYADCELLIGYEPSSPGPL